MDPRPTAETVAQVWTASLVIYLVVVVVVALLRVLILNTARAIRGGVSDIWTVGQKVANNTIHIALLNKTNAVAGRILASAVGVVHATAAIEAHALRTARTRARVRRDEALGDGIADAGIATFLERKREAARQDPAWITRQLAKVDAGIGSLAKTLGTRQYLGGAQPNP